MASNLYEILGVDKSATPEEIRKAYKKKALSTHPDRLPPGVSEEEKQKANEQFRLVNNAYEILTNVENRKVYDQHGVWPPPTAADDAPFAGPSYTREPFSGFDPFFGRSSRRARGFAFSDPFELFNSLFGDLHRAFADDPFFADAPTARSPFDSMFGPSPLRARHGDLFGGAPSPFGMGFGGHPFLEMMNGMGAMGAGGSNVHSYSSVTQAVGGGGQWVSESKTTRTVNGRTETTTKRRDAQGNEHVTYTSPEGERYTVNGVEQPPQDRYLPSSQQPPMVNYSSHPSAAAYGYAPPPPVNYANHPQPAAGYSVPVRGPEAQYAQAPPVSRHHSHSSHSSHHHASRLRGGADSGSVRRSSSGRHHAEPGYYEHDDAPRRRTSSQHSRTSHHHHHHSSSAKYGANMNGYSDGFGNGNVNRATGGYTEPPPRSHSHHSHHSSRHDERRYTDNDDDGDRRDEHHRRRGTHGW